MSKNITVYTTNACAYCLMVKKYLESKGQEYKIVNLDEQPEQRETLRKISGVQTVPVTVIQNESAEPSITVGWNPSKLSAALAA
ncbi:MAG: glutaredoxin family protein [Candidatus Saccharibacteria bacterium]|nr:glutaredoxin family protein [Candidatus Saccharibacteria bacterium]